MSNEHLAAEAVASRVLALAAGLSNPDVTVNSTCRLCDLGFDDLDAVELVMAVEDDFEVDIDVSEYEDAPEKFLAMPLQVLIDMALKAVGQSPAAALRSSGPAEDVKPNPQAFQHCVTPDMITAAIVAADYHVLPGTRITVCTLTLRNGTKVLGYKNYGAIDPARQDWKQGRQAAYDMAREKLWELEGYALRERLAAHTSVVLDFTPDQEAALLEQLRNAPPGTLEPAGGQTEKSVEDMLAIFPPHERRVIEEYCELVGRRNRLIDFLGSMKFQGLPAEDQDLLKRQLDVMNDYAKILVKLCDRFEVPAGLVCPGLVPVDDATDGDPSPHYDPEALAKKMVDRFLGWKLPQNFAPDGGVSFVPPFHWPTGTNLLHAGQALEMFRYCLGLDAAEEVQP